MTEPEPTDLEQRIAALEAKVETLQTQLAARAQQPSLTLPRHLTAEARVASSASTPPPPPPPPTPGSLPTSTVATEPGHVDMASPRPSSWTEQVTTEAALKWAGLVLLFLAAAFLVSTAITRGWIGPKLQLTGAVVLGLVLIGLGTRARENLPRWSEPLGVAGLAILFISAGAASEWLDLGDTDTGTITTCVVTAFALIMAYAYRWVSAALVALLASLIVLTWVGAPDVYSLGASIGFTFVLAALLHLLAIEHRWPVLYLATAATVMIVQLVGATEEESVFVVQVFLIGTAIAHWLVPVVMELRDDASDQLTRLAGRVTLVVPAWLWTSTVVLHDLDTNPAIVVSVAVSVAAIASALAIRPRVDLWLWAAQLLGAAVAISAGLSYWLDGSTLLGALAAQAAVMLVLAIKLEDGWFFWQSVITAGVVSIVAFGLTVEAIDDNPAWGADLVHLFVFLMALGIGWTLRTSDVGRVIGGCAYAATLVWVASVCIHFGQGQLIISAIWAALGVALVVAGLGRQNMLVARVGLITLAVVVAKLLTVDLAEIDTFWRAGLFFVIGLGMLWLSYSVPGLVGRGDSSSDDSA